MRQIVIIETLTAFDDNFEALESWSDHQGTIRK